MGFTLAQVAIGTMSSGDSSTGDLVDRLLNEFVERQLSGGAPKVSDYCARFPEHAKEIRELFSTIAAIENMKPEDRGSPVAEHIGDYHVLGEIGRGGMGIVYEAEHQTLGRRVALKVLPTRLAKDPRALERFEREARAIARMHHTNIVPLFEVGEDQGRPFLAMQLISGESLDHVIAGLPDRIELDSRSSDTELTRHFRWVAKIGCQVAGALSYAHTRGIIHRDIKPSNIINDNSDVVWLTDFGLAKSDDEQMTQTGDVVGTLRYMAPERFRGQCDRRSDVYALGLTLYELLTGKPAFGDDDRLHLIQSIAQTDPSPLADSHPMIPRDLETIVMRSIS
ncbi:MAG: serine/threonine-protein kinase, partial [Planctomycetota bacterium]